MSPKTYDVIVIGAGPAGEALAGRVAAKGHATAIVESHLVGGECSFYACMPSKALLRPAQALAEARRVPGAAEAVTADVDVEAVLRRRDEVVHDLDDAEQVPWLDDRGVDLIRGHGRLDGERRVRVGDELYEARQAVVIAVGSGAAVPPIPGLVDVEPWTNREVTTAAPGMERIGACRPNTGSGGPAVASKQLSAIGWESTRGASRRDRRDAQRAAVGSSTKRVAATSARPPMPTTRKKTSAVVSSSKPKTNGATTSAAVKT
jgi:hypothetical protein